MNDIPAQPASCNTCVAMAGEIVRTCRLYRVHNSGEIPPLAHGWRSVIALGPAGVASR